MNTTHTEVAKQVAVDSRRTRKKLRRQDRREARALKVSVRQVIA